MPSWGFQLDAERVLVLVRYSGRGKSSGLELAQMGTPAANLFHVCDGSVTTFVHYWDRESAFPDLDLAPEGDAADSPS